MNTGQKLLGVIKKVNDYDMVVSLPNHLTGFVSVDQVSKNFSESFEAFSAAVESGETDPKVSLTIPCVLWVLNVVFGFLGSDSCSRSSLQGGSVGGLQYLERRIQKVWSQSETN